MKLLVDGKWVNKGSIDQPNWKLLIFPIITKVEPTEGEVGSFVIFDLDGIEGNVYDSVNRLLDTTQPTSDITLHNFGTYKDDDEYGWSLFLTTNIPTIKDDSYLVWTKEGYVWLDSLKPNDTEDPLDMWIIDQLRSLTGPKTIQFNQGI